MSISPVNGGRTKNSTQKHNLKGGDGGSTLSSLQSAGAVLLCMATMGMSLVYAVQNRTLDQGQTITLEQMKEDIRLEAIRIKQDPHMPPQAKAAALGAMQRGQVIGPYENKARHGGL